MKSKNLWLAGIVTLCMIPGSILADVPTYRLVPLPSLPQSWDWCEAVDINEQGQVVGSCWPTPWVVAWIDGQPIELGYGHGRAISAEGTILGGGGAFEPFLWDAVSGRRALPIAEGVLWLETFGGMDVAGRIAGTAMIDDMRYQAFVLDGQSYTFLLPPGAEQSWCRAMNSVGHAVVTWTAADSIGAFLYRDGQMIALELPAASYLWISALNDQDVMVGSLRDEQNVEHIFKYDFPNDQWTELATTPDGSGAIPYAINNHGQVVGQVLPQPNTSKAALWDSDGAFYLLNDLIPQELGWDLQRALSITDAGVICGGEGQMEYPARAFLLIPYECAGEIVADGRIDLADLAALLSSFGSCDGDAIFEPRGDLNTNGCIELDDLGEMVAKFGTSCW